MNEKGMNINSIKTENYSIILNCIRRAPMSRADIAKVTGLTKSAVTIITKHLIDEGQIVEVGTESIDFGRHPMMLDIVEDRRFAMGISLTRQTVAVGIYNLKLRSFGLKSADVSSFKTPCEVFLWAYNEGLKILDKNNISKDICLGIGVSAPGPIDYNNGVILAPPNFPLFQNFNVRKCLADVTDMPVFVNNSPVLMAMYENCMRTPQVKNCIFVVIEHGVGSAIIQNGSINKGFAGFSGEIGHTTVDVNGPKCNCGNYGCLEGYITRKAIENKYNTPYEQIVDKAISGDKPSLEIMKKIAFYISSGVINAINMLDLEAVIIAGELNYRHELLFKLIDENLEERCIIKKTHSVEVIPALDSLKKDNSFTATNVVDKYFRQMLK